MKRSAFYRNLFNSKTGFFQPKNDKGEWIEPFDLISMGRMEVILLLKGMLGNTFGMYPRISPI